MKKRLLSILLLFAMTLTLLPMTAHAVEPHWKVFCEKCNKEVVNRDDAKYVYEDGNYCRYVTKCPDCHSELVSDMLVFHCHSGSETPTCTKGVICDNCGNEYGALGHDWSFTSHGDGTHTRTCQREGCGVTETVNCSGGTATCIAKAVCRECGAEYGEKDPDNHTGGTATCTQKAVCKDCNQEYGELDLNKHSVIPATCIAPATCRDCGKELEPINPDKHSGGEATCIAKATCELCKKEYGEIDPDNHDYEATEIIYPTCYEPGSATLVCKNCNDTYTQTIPVTGHRFYTLPWKEVSTAEGSGIELECDMCHIKETRPLYVIEYKAGETYTDTGWTNITLLSELQTWSGKYTFEDVGEKGLVVKTTAGKLLLTVTQTQGDGDTDVFTILVDEGVTSEDGDTAVIWSEGHEPEYGVKCVFLSGHTHKAVNPSAWESDGTEHWQLCACGAKLNKAAHTGGTATCMAKAVCEVCGGEYGEKDPDNHAAGCAPQWTITEAEHTQKYSRCGKVTVAKAPHTFGPWTTTQEPAPEQTGEKEHTCEVCEYKQTEIIPATGYVYYTIRATAGAGGSISPSGDVSVREGLDRTFTITPNRGYSVSNIKIDGVNVGTARSYTFENVTENHTIEVSFQKTTGSPQTGDGIDLPLLCALLTVSALGLAGIALFRRRRAK